MKRTLSPLLALLLALPSPAQADPDTTNNHGPRLRIGTWNLEHLGQRRDPPRPPDAKKRIADFVREIGVDVLAVQEIGSAASLDRLTQELGATWNYVLGTTGGFSGGDSGRIGVGFLWNEERVALLSAQELMGLERRLDNIPIFHRVPVLATFRSRNDGIDFRAVVVHLKAGQGTANEHKRLLEVTSLRRHLDALLQRPGEDPDLVVLGDFNHTYGTREYAALTSNGAFRFTTSTDNKPTILHFDEPIDHLALSRGLLEEYLPGSRTVHDRIASADRTSWRLIYSDHLPVTIDLDASLDRDPDARFSPVPEGNPLRPGRTSVSGPIPPAPQPVVPDNKTESVPPAGPEALPPVPLPSPLGRGDRVRVLFRDNGGMALGTLLAAPDRFVHLLTDDQRRVAFPMETIQSLMLWP